MRACSALLLVLAAGVRADVLVVASSGGSQVTLIDAESFERLAEIKVGDGPHEIAVSPDGEWAWVANSGARGTPGNSISIIDLRRRSPIRTVTLDDCQPHDVRLGRKGGPLWVTCATSRAVLELDPWSGAARKRWDIDQDGAWMLSASSDSDRVYTANLEGGGATIIDRRKGAVKSIKTSEGEIGLDVAPDDRTFWLTNLNANNVTVVDAVSGRIVGAFDAGEKAPVRVRITPDGQRAVVTFGGASKIGIFDVRKRTPVAWLDIEGPAKVLALSRTGTRAAASLPSKNRVVIFDLDPPKVVRYVDIPQAPDGVAWTVDPQSTSRAQVAFTIDDRELVPEGIAWDPGTKAFFVSSTYKRKIVRVDGKGTATDFTSEGQDGLWGVVGMRVDAKRRELWAASGHVGEAMPMIRMDASEEGRSAIHVYDIGSGRLKRRYEIKDDKAHFLNDLVLTDSGDLYVTDTRSGAVYRVLRGSNEIEPFIAAPELSGANGIAYDAKRRRLYVTARGFVIAIEVDSRQLRPLTFPEYIAYRSSDGLYLHRNALISVNDRVTRYPLDAAGLRVISAEILEVAHPALGQPTTGVIAGDDFYLVANSHLQRFAAVMRGDESLRAGLREVTVLRIPLRKSS